MLVAARGASAVKLDEHLVQDDGRVEVGRTDRLAQCAVRDPADLGEAALAEGLERSGLVEMGAFEEKRDVAWLWHGGSIVHREVIWVRIGEGARDSAGFPNAGCAPRAFVRMGRWKGRARSRGA